MVSDVLRARLARFAVLGMLCLLQAGCSWMGKDTPAPAHREPVPGYAALGDAAAVRAALIEQYLDWQGVPYRIGGSDRRGLDCSAFVQLTYRERFGIELPRDTAAQRTVGAPLDENDIAPGDLLFFDTGVFANHVGIYIGERRFLHVSTRAGVMLSSLGDSYWGPRFSGAVRVH